MDTPSPFEFLAAGAAFFARRTDGNLIGDAWVPAASGQNTEIKGVVARL